MPIGGPVLDTALNGFFRLHHDDGIQKTPEGANGTFEFSNMGLRQITLIGCGLNLINRERCQNHPTPCVWFPKNTENFPAVTLHLLLEPVNIVRSRRCLKFLGGPIQWRLLPVSSVAARSPDFSFSSPSFAPYPKTLPLRAISSVLRNLFYHSRQNLICTDIIGLRLKIENQPVPKRRVDNRFNVLVADMNPAFR